MEDVCYDCSSGDGGWGQGNEGERESEDGGGVCLFALCYFVPPEHTENEKSETERERERNREGGDDGGMLANSMSGSRGSRSRSQQRREGWTDR